MGRRGRRKRRKRKRKRRRREEEGEGGGRRKEEEEEKKGRMGGGGRRRRRGYIYIYTRVHACTCGRRGEEEEEGMYFVLLTRRWTFCCGPATRLHLRPQADCGGGGGRWRFTHCF
jgi:hypothetical protein